MWGTQLVAVVQRHIAVEHHSLEVEHHSLLVERHSLEVKHHSLLVERHSFEVERRSRVLLLVAARRILGVGQHHHTLGACWGWLAAQLWVSRKVNGHTDSLIHLEASLAGHRAMNQRRTLPPSEAR